MSQTPNKESANQRVTGRSLRLLAHALESPLTGKLLFNAAIKKMGIADLHQMDIPPDVVPYLPLHLGRPAEAEPEGEGQPGGAP